jgi:hypothetical protein
MRDALLADRIGQRWRETRVVCQVCGEGGASYKSPEITRFLQLLLKMYV